MDLSRLDSPGIFEAFGFGSTAILAALLFGDWGGASLALFLEFNELSKNFELVFVPITIFVAYVSGLGLMVFGSFGFNTHPKDVAQISVLQAEAANHTNPRVWETFRELLRKNQFLSGSLGLATWCSLLFCFNLVHMGLMEHALNLGALFGVFICVLVGIYAALGIQRNVYAYLIFTRSLRLLCRNTKSENALPTSPKDEKTE